jgi:hypothetical protein
MIPNLVAVLIGLALSYEAIFSPPQTGVSNATIAICGGAVAALAILARWSRPMAWQSTLNVFLGALLLLYAGVRSYFGADNLETFWTALLSGIVISIGALWSVLYRPSPEATKAAT